MEGRSQDNVLSDWGDFDRPYRHSSSDISSLDLLVKQLDKIADDGLVKQVIERRFCYRCEYPVEGALEESNLEYVPGYLHKKWFEPQKGPSIVVGYGTPKERIVHSNVKRMITPYELRQLIVRSGIYSNEQLAGFRFTQHELEVNAKAFLERRCILKCACNSHDFVYGFIPRNWDTSTHNEYEEFWTPVDLEAHVRFLVDEEWREYSKPTPLTGVESDFVAGNPVRTGYRVRSPEARQKRAQKRKKPSPSDLVVFTRPVPDPIAIGTGLYSVNPNLELRLEFLFRPPKRPGRRTRRKRRIRKTYSPEAIERLSRKDRLSHPCKGMSKKDRYFLRKNGSFYHSVHHPGEIVRKHADLSRAKHGNLRSHKPVLRDKG